MKLNSHSHSPRNKSIPPSGAGIALAAGLCLASTLGLGENTPAEAVPFRFAFTSRMFTDVSENDAKAAIHLWSQTLTRERGLAGDSVTLIYNGEQKVRSALRNHEADGLAMTTDEYWAVRHEAVFDHLLLNVRGNSITEEYLLLAHKDGPVKTLADLRGRSLVVFRSPATSLAMICLDTALIENGLPRAADLCARTESIPKLSRVVLAVFFRKTDACLVTRKGFETMIELNPQVGRQLNVLFTSPEVVTAGFYFPTGTASPLRTSILSAPEKIGETVAGKQMLTIFQCERVEERPLSSLDSTLELLEKHQRLCQSLPSAAEGPPTLAIPKSQEPP